jgi:5S rRNA maturation endonuclease (ribonuclease M5)
MSNIYRYAKHIAHFQMPNAMLSKLTYMRADELRLLVFLNSEFQRTSKSELSFTAEPISRQTGIHPNNLGAARKGLMSLGLLLFRKDGRTYRYICCDPTDKTPVPDGSSTESSACIDFDGVTANVLRRYFEPHLQSCKDTSNGLSGCCPFPSHDDKTPSFSVELADGNGGRWNCFGCKKSGKLIDFEVYLSEDTAGVTIDRTEAHRLVVDRLRSLGVTASTTGLSGDVVYSYTDEEGEIITETVRPNGKKEGMYRRRPNPDAPGRYINSVKGCANLLYRLPEVIEADTVIVVEGEPDVETVRKLHLLDVGGRTVAATTIANGAGNWLPEHSTRLKDKWVILVGDNDVDGKGLRYMEQVKASLSGKVRNLNHVQLPPEYRDISHYLESHTAEDFIEIVGQEWLSPIVSI